MAESDSLGNERIAGSVEEIIYSNEDNGYMIFDLATGDGDLVTAVGYLPFLAEGDSLVLYGRWVHNPRYGRQFSVASFEKNLPADKASMLRYLASRTIKGIGPKTAQNIIDEFGEDAFEVIENHPEWLASIPGISKKKAQAIHEDFCNKAGIRQAMLFFRDWFGPSATVRIYKKWGSRAVELAKKNPYLICGEIEGVGFERTDRMAESLGVDRSSPDRVDSGILYTLLRSERQQGNVCLPRKKLTAEASLLLSVSEGDADKAVDRLLTAGKLKYLPAGGENLIYASKMFDAEQFIAARLVLLDKLCAAADLSDVERLIDRSETYSGIHYAALQRKAIANTLSSGVTVITGGPGTGKTTVIRALISIFENMKLKVALCAPTGRAAKRMSEATSHEAKTIHRLLEMGYSEDDGKNEFNRDGDDPLEEDVIIIDEASMIDTPLMYALLQAVKPGARLLIIGDADQLPSVGAGNILRDIIDSGRFPTVRLTEIFRQASESLIVTNAHAINEGKMPELSVKDNDFFFISRRTDREAAQTVADLYSNRLPRAYGEAEREGIQVISPSRRGEAGTENLNIILQAALNPPAHGKKEIKFRDILFREGDRVMQTRNNYDLEWTDEDESKVGQGIFNGDIGVIREIRRASVTVDFDGRIVDYDYDLLEDLETAYAVTVHKSQGSEYRTVIIPVCSSTPALLLTRNLLYTAVTRAQRRVIIVGQEQTVKRMVDNVRQSSRYTGLALRLRER